MMRYSMFILDLAHSWSHAYTNATSATNEATDTSANNTSAIQCTLFCFSSNAFEHAHTQAITPVRCSEWAGMVPVMVHPLRSPHAVPRPRAHEKRGAIEHLSETA